MDEHTGSRIVQLVKERCDEMDNDVRNYQYTPKEWAVFARENMAQIAYHLIEIKPRDVISFLKNDVDFEKLLDLCSNNYDVIMDDLLPWFKGIEPVSAADTKYRVEINLVDTYYRRPPPYGYAVLERVIICGKLEMGIFIQSLNNDSAAT